MISYQCCSKLTFMSFSKTAFADTFVCLCTYHNYVMTNPDGVTYVTFQWHSLLQPPKSTYSTPAEADTLLLAREANRQQAKVSFNVACVVFHTLVR